MGATVTSILYFKMYTNSMGVDCELIDDILDESLSLRKSVVTLPVTSNEEFSHLLL